jgi:hypothetical protein
MKKLSNNTDLYNYLLSLGDILANRGSPNLAESVRFAARSKVKTATVRPVVHECHVMLKATTASPSAT